MKRRNKLLGLVGVATFIASGTFAAATPMANAKTAVYVVANDDIICNTMTGTGKFSAPMAIPPALPGGNVETIKGTLDGCIDKDNSQVLIAPSKFVGTVAYSESNCTYLEDPSVDGSVLRLTVSWKTVSGKAKITPNTSVFSIPFTGGEQPIDSWTVERIQNDFGVPNQSVVTGAFTGGLAGRGSKGHWELSQDLIGLLGYDCQINPLGVRSVNIGLGQLYLGQ
jgi:hypothetical protein